MGDGGGVGGVETGLPDDGGGVPGMRRVTRRRCLITSGERPVDRRARGSRRPFAALARR